MIFHLDDLLFEMSIHYSLESRFSTSPVLRAPRVASFTPPPPLFGYRAVALGTVPALFLWEGAHTQVRGQQEPKDTFLVPTCLGWKGIGRDNGRGIEHGSHDGRIQQQQP